MNWIKPPIYASNSLTKKFKAKMNYMHIKSDIKGAKIISAHASPKTLLLITKLLSNHCAKSADKSGKRDSDN